MDSQQSSYHRFVVRVFHDLASLGAGQIAAPAADHADYDTAAGSAADQGVPASGEGKLIYG